MKTAREYANEAAHEAWHACDLEGEMDIQEAEEAILKQIPLDALVKCVEAGKQAVDVWGRVCGRVRESMGDNNPRYEAIDAAMTACEKALSALEAKEGK